MLHAQSGKLLSVDGDPLVDEFADIVGSMVVIGNLAEATIEAINGIDIPWKHHRTTRVGYIRQSLY